MDSQLGDSMRSLSRSMLVLLSSCAVAPATLAQITNVTADQQTPTPGVGHDYIHMLSETVDPSTGALSIRIGVPVPPGRGLTLPFAFAYDSNGVHIPMIVPANGIYYWATYKAPLSQGGWS